MMQTINSAFEADLGKMIAEDIDQAKNDMSAGLMTHDDYKFKAGYISGLRHVIELFDEVNKRLSER